MPHFNGARARLTNLGTLRRSAGAGESYIGWNVDNAAAAAVEVQTGGLDFRGGGSGTAASYTVAAGASLQFNGGAHSMDAATSLGGDGGIFVQGGSVDWDGAIALGGASGVSGGTLRVDGSATFGGGYSQSGGALRGGGTVFFDGAANTSTGGNMHDAGTKTVRGTMSVAPASSVSLLENGALANEGTLTFSGPGIFYAYGGATIRNAPGALFDIRTDADMPHFNGARARLTNLGTLRKSAGTGETSVAWNLSNEGIVSTASGTLRLSSFTQPGASALTLLNGGNIRFDTTPSFSAGEISGSGVINSSLRNVGAVLRPGSPTGTMTVTGNYVQLAGGTLEIDINDRPASGLFDKLVVNGSATLGGTFALAVAGGFAADPGDAFDVLLFGSSSGQFATVTGLDPGNGVSYTESYAADRFTLTALASSPDELQESPLFADNYESWAARISDGSGLDKWQDDVLADPDHDGRNNLLEYAFATDPLAPDRHSFPLVKLIEIGGESFLQCTYCVRNLKADIQITCERSEDLGTWSGEGH